MTSSNCLKHEPTKEEVDRREYEGNSLQAPMIHVYYYITNRPIGQ